MGKTAIAWATDVWNPVSGCTKVSAGCRNCYAETLANRFWGERAFTDVQCHEDRLDAPLHWRKPRRVFANSMSDLFHDAVPDAFIDRVFAVMALAPQHTFQVLTKRPERMRAYLQNKHTEERVARASVFFVPNKMLAQKGIEADLQQEAMAGWAKWPLPNVWLGVSVEDQRAADERIPLLLQAPAAVRFLSCEPLLGAIDLDLMPGCRGCNHPGNLHVHWNEHGRCSVCDGKRHERVDWVIAGGESGTGARPCDVAWIRSIVKQCKEAGTACFVKQLGAKPTSLPCYVSTNDRLRDRKGSDMEEWPEDLRVQEVPR